MSAPPGERHGMCRYPNEVVEKARDMHDEGVGPTQIARELDVPLNTLQDWIYYRTRGRAA